MESVDAAAAVARAFRSDYGRCVAIVLRQTGSLAAAEDAVQDAFTAAAETWSTKGVPPNPQAWIVSTARNAAIDRHRREATAARLAPVVATDEPAPGPSDTGTDVDTTGDELAVVFLCCHPALSPESRVALTLRYVGGLTTPEVARAFGVPEATIGQRLSRAKSKVSVAGIPLRLPPPKTWDERMASVLAVIYAVYNEGYAARTGSLVRDDLAVEAIRLARELFRMAPHDPEVRGLLALLLLLDARRPARVDADGALVPLPQQDRSLWRRDEIDEGHGLVRECLAIGRPGPYQLQAAIQAVHCDAPSDEETDWSQILALYDTLVPLLPTTAVTVNRAVVLGKVEGPESALAALESVGIPLHPSALLEPRRTGGLNRDLAQRLRVYRLIHDDDQCPIERNPRRAVGDRQRRHCVARPAADLHVGGAGRRRGRGGRGGLAFLGDPARSARRRLRGHRMRAGVVLHLGVQRARHHHDGQPRRQRRSRGLAHRPHPRLARPARTARPAPHGSPDPAHDRPRGHDLRRRRSDP